MRKKNKVAIKVENLSKTYSDDFKAVDRISFEVYQGEIFGLLGPNGAGKTTTLEIIETLKEKTDGSVEVFGTDLDRDPFKIKQMIGVQLQESGFYPGLSLKQTVDLFADLYEVKVDVDEMLEQVNLLDKKDEIVKNLSGGQKQRFSIATTLINKPEIVFLDEPTTGLDPQARRNLWELIAQIRDQGATVVITTHYMDEAEYLCDRVAIMDSGKILEIKPPAKLINELIDSGFEKEMEVKGANLEDVFLNLTGKTLRD